MHYAVIALQAAHGGSGNHQSGVLAMPGNDWLMKRNCSLSPRQVGWFYLSIVSFSLAIALCSAWRGAWLVLPFAGLELARLVCARHTTDYERVTLANGRLVVETASGGRVARQELNPYWVRVELGESAPALVVSRSGRQTVQVGCFLDPYSRRKFAQELVAALRRQ